jgi:hypothetical protein
MRPRFSIALVALLVVALSVLVGFVGSPHSRFDWELAKLFGTALGTTLLALATGWLAYSTRSEVRATQELAALTREDQAARDRPVVMVELWNHDPGKVGGVLKIQLINVGLGPALRVRLGAMYVGVDDGLPKPKIQEVTVTAIPPNDRAEVELSVTYPCAGLGHAHESTISDHRHLRGQGRPGRLRDRAAPHRTHATHLLPAVIPRSPC